MGKTKRVATGEETVVAIPIIVEIVQVQVTAIRIAVQVRHVAIAIRVLPEIYKTPSMPPPFEVITISGLNLILYQNTIASYTKCLRFLENQERLSQKP